MTTIHPSAVIDPKAQIADGCEIGPFCLIGPEVVLGAGNKLLSHVVITGNTRIGPANVFHPHTVIGGVPQDKKYKGENTGLIIGTDNIFREAVTINAGTMQDKVSGGITRVGDSNLFMVNVHLGHDCQFGSHGIFANNVMIAGHVHCGNRVILNGGVGVNQFVTIGDFAYVAGYAQLHHDVPPYVKITDSDRIRALNAVGLKRSGAAEADVDSLEQAFRRLFLRKGTPVAVALAEFDAAAARGETINPLVKSLVDFMRRRSSCRNGRFLETLRGK
jgi:UDP-N-acetylglucosamine acyltransferase